MRLAAGLLLSAVLTASLAACASTIDGTPTAGSPPPTDSSSASTPASASAPPTGFPPTSGSGSSTSGAPTGTLTENQAKAALLGAAQIGTGFAPTTSSNGSDPLPCAPNDPPLDEQFPPSLKVQVTFASSDGQAAINEEIEAYPDESTAIASLKAGEQGLSCGSGKLGSQTVTITGPTDLTNQLGVPVDIAEAWGLKATSVLDGALVVARLGQHLVIFSFAATAKADNGNLPNVPTIVSAGVQKVAAALK